MPFFIKQAHPYIYLSWFQVQPLTWLNNSHCFCQLNILVMSISRSEVFKPAFVVYLLRIFFFKYFSHFNFEQKQKTLTLSCSRLVDSTPQSLLVTFTHVWHLLDEVFTSVSYLIHKCFYWQKEYLICNCTNPSFKS